MAILVSIIIPIYNTASFLDEAVQSVLNQSFTNWELILVDDGSSDSSMEICKRYLNHPAVKLIQQHNQGVSVARNNGLLQATGKYVFFMDSDDTIDENFIQTSVEVAEKEDADIVVVGNYFGDRLLNICALPTCAMFLKNSFLKTHSEIRFPKGIQPCEDGLFSHQLLALTNKIGFNGKGIYNYRKHECQNHQTINENPQKVLNQIPQWFAILEDFYHKHNLFKTKSLHLALFMQHEPLAQRYLKMSLNAEQKEFILNLVKNFVSKNISPYLKNKDRKKLNKLFIKFIDSENHTEFDQHLSDYKLKMEQQRRTKIAIAKVIYFGKKRVRKINKINTAFDRRLDL